MTVCDRCQDRTALAEPTTVELKINSLGQIHELDGRTWDLCTPCRDYVVAAIVEAVKPSPRDAGKERSR